MLLQYCGYFLIEACAASDWEITAILSPEFNYIYSDTVLCMYMYKYMYDTT